MDLRTNEVFRNMPDIQDEFSEYFARIPKEYHDSVETLLNGKDRAVADKTTSAGRSLLYFAEKIKSRRRKEKNARRARRKQRRRRK
jgi:hypothetical protein